MKNFKRVFACLMVLAMMVPLFAAYSFAAEPTGDDIADHWVTLAAKYSTSSHKIICKNGVVAEDGFAFTQNENDGIDVFIPDYATLKGGCSTVVVTNKYKTPLTDLDIKMTLADDAAFSQDSKGTLGTFSFAWLDQPITEIGYMDKTTSRGISDSEMCATNGIRQIGEETKKGLYVVVGSAAIYNDTQQAAYLSIYMFDGEFKDAVDGEGGWGYRWTFTSRNGEGPLGDNSGISRNYIHDLDLADGLNFKVRSDAVLGFVVSVNGTEYYRGTGENCVAFFPNNTKGTGTGGGWDVDDYDVKNPNWIANMNYIRDDIDLSALREVDEGDGGYVTVSATASNNQNPHFNFTIDSVNGTPAAKFGSAITWGDWMVDTEATCKAGQKHRNSTNSDLVQTVKTAPVREHTWIVNEDTDENGWKVTQQPTCSTVGVRSRTCSECSTKEKKYDIPTVPHQWIVNEDTDENGWKVTTPATCTSTGLMTRYCIYGEKQEKAIAKTPHNWIVDETTDADGWKIDPAPEWFKVGKKVRHCADCTATETQTIPQLNPFTDIPQGKWFTLPCLECYSKGYMTGTSATTFGPNVVMTRAQFVTILSKVDEADTSTYEGTHFNDVPEGKWFSKPVEWAYTLGYAGGTGNGNFSPDSPVTRETLAQFFYTYAKAKGYDVSASADLSGFIDVGKVAGWAKTAMSWAVGSGLISGTTATTLAPKDTATRATVAVIVNKFVDVIVPKEA